MKVVVVVVVLAALRGALGEDVAGVAAPGAADDGGVVDAARRRGARGDDVAGPELGFPLD